VKGTTVGDGMVKWFLGEAVRQLSDNALGCRCCLERACDGDGVFRTWLWADQEDEIDLSVMAITESVL
jgi:hypothetical protein